MPHVGNVKITTTARLHTTPARHSLHASQLSLRAPPTGSRSTEDGRTRHPAYMRAPQMQPVHGGWAWVGRGERGGEGAERTMVKVFGSLGQGRQEREGRG